MTVRASRRTYEYHPDQAVTPGETLMEWLALRDMTQAEFARRADLSTKHVSQVVNGIAGLTAEVSLAFANVTDIPASFWTQLDANYRVHQARLADDQSLAERVEILESFPITELVRRGVMKRIADPVGQLRELLRFFGVATVDALEGVWLTDVRLRASRAFPPNEAALAAWLRIAELEAQTIQVAPFDPESCEAAIQDFRSYTSLKGTSWVKPLQERCASAGIALVIVKELPKCRINGATRWLGPNKAMVALSMRHRRHDIVWFTFFHELAHLLRHSKRQTFLDADGALVAQDLELDADRFAGATLIPAIYEDALRQVATPSDAKALASEIGVDVSIVVGRLQHEGVIPFNKWNEMIPRYQFHDDRTA